MGAGSFVSRTEGADSAEQDLAAVDSARSRASADTIDEDILDVRFLLKGIWRGKWIVLVFALVGVFLGYRGLSGFSPAYEASMVVLPSGQEFNAGGGSSAVSGLVESLGISVGSQQSTSFDRFTLVLSSLELANLLQEEYGLFDRVFGGNKDPETGEWKRPDEWRFEVEQRIRSALHLSTWRPPNMESLAGFVGGGISIESTKAGAVFKRITFSDPDPEFALFLLETVYREADNLLREQDREEALARRDYLERQLSAATIAESRQMLTGLLEGEERRLMLMSGDFPYASRVIQSPFVSSRPTTANVTRSFVFPLVGALGFGILMILLYAVARRE